MLTKIQVDKSKLTNFCRRNNIAQLSFFGSVLRDDFSPESDIDVLVDFEDGYAPGFLRIAQLERDLSALLNDRRVDLRTFDELSRYFRNEVRALAEVQYAQS